MIEIIHLTNRWGKKFVAVLGNRDFSSITMNDYMDKYYAGKRKPHYPLPAIRYHTVMGKHWIAVCTHTEYLGTFLIEKEWRRD